VRVGNKRFRSLIPVKVKAKSKAKVNIKSILKPTRSGNVVYVQHCSNAPPTKKGGLRQPSEAIAKETWSRFPTWEWNLDQLPINKLDRYDQTIFCDQEMRRALNLGQLPTKVVSLPLLTCNHFLILSFANLLSRNSTSTWYRTRELLAAE
jgi:hypothetical protein